MATQGIAAGYYVIYAWMLLLPMSLACAIGALGRRERPAGLAISGLTLSVMFLAAARFLLQWSAGQ